jgi:hypothetical protein
MSELAIPGNSWWHHKEELEKLAKTFDKSAKLALKQGGVWKLSSAMTTYATTIGRTVYIPADWTREKVIDVLPHECLGHIKQFRYCGLGIHPTLGIFPGMFFIYVWGIIFPIFLAWGRYRMELHAETKAWEYKLENNLLGPVALRIRAVRFAKAVGGKPYVYSVPKRWATWGFKKRAEKVINARSRKKAA